MLDALVSNGATDEAVSLLREWKAKVRPNAVMYSTLVKGFASCHRTGGALELMAEMRADGVEMSTSMYNSLIDVHSRVGAIEEILTLIDFMTKEGCNPDDFTSSLVVKAYCVKGNLKQAVQVFTTMRRTRSEGDTVIFNTILDGCVRHNDMGLADQLLNGMEEYMITPSSFTLGIIVKMWGRRRNLDKAFAAVETLPARYGFRLNTPVSTCLMCACLMSDDVDRALGVFQNIRLQGRGADAKAYNSLVSGCTRLSRLELAARLVEEAHLLTPKAVALDQGVFAGQSMESGVLDDLLRALVRADKWETIGAPLLGKLQAHNVPVTFALGASGGSGARGGPRRG
jgi:pentatricopeptide repeat protein